MRSHSSSSSDTASPYQIRFQQFLIPPFHRLRFTILFILATGLGWFLVAWVLRSLQTPVLPTSWQEGGILGTFVSGLVSGLIVGATQWLVMRRYAPDWLWILANSAGYVILMTTLQGWQLLIREIFQRGVISALLASFSPQAILAIVGVIGTLLTAVSTIWLGLTQWLVLRRYASPSWGWVFVPSIAVLLSSSLFTIKTLVSLTGISLPLDAGVLGAGVLGITQAIALSALRKKESEATGTRNSQLSTAPEIRSYRQVRKLAKRLRSQLNQEWKSEIPSDRPLTYLVGVDAAGAIAAYEPVNPPAINQADQTPLPALVQPPDSAPTEDHPHPLARFQVAFMPSGRLKILSWRGIPLLWIGLGMLIVIVGVSAIVGFLGGKLTNPGS